MNKALIAGEGCTLGQKSYLRYSTSKYDCMISKSHEKVFLKWEIWPLLFSTAEKSIDIFASYLVTRVFWRQEHVQNFSQTRKNKSRQMFLALKWEFLISRDHGNALQNWVNGTRIFLYRWNECISLVCGIRSILTSNVTHQNFIRTHTGFSRQIIIGFKFGFLIRKDRYSGLKNRKNGTLVL